MRVASIVGSGAESHAESIVTRLRDRGPVARVRAGDATADGGAAVASGAAETTCVVAEEGVRVDGPPRPLDRLLDDLVVDHDYAVVTGHADARLPQVVLGETEPGGEVIARFDAADPDPEAAVEAVEAVEPRETLASLVSRVKDSSSADRAGAIATFTGRVRALEGPDDVETTHLEFEAYDGVAAERMAAIRADLEDREGVYEVLLHHRTGVVEAGEDIVFVVVLAGHRREAFETVSDGIDRLKSEVPLFKKEVTVEDAFWAHERD